MIFWLALRWSKEKKGNLSTSTIQIAALSMFVATVVMVLAQSITSGFRLAIKQKAVSFVGDVVIQKYGASEIHIPLVEDDHVLKSQISQWDNVKHVRSVLLRPAILKGKQAITGILAKGVGVDFDGMGIFPSPSRGSIVMSRTLAMRLDINKGEKPRLFFFTQDSLGGITMRLPRSFLVDTFYHTGLKEFDDYVVFFNLNELQEIFCSLLSNCVTTYEVYLNKSEVSSEQLESLALLAGPDMSVDTTRELLPNLFNWLDYLDINIYIISALLLLVGLLSMGAAFLTMVLERVNSFGVLKALGMPTFKLVLILGFQFAFIIILSISLGDILSYLLVMLQENFKIIPLDADVYYLDYVPAEWKWSDTFLVNVFSITLSLIAMVIPGFYLWRLPVSRVIRMD